MATASEEIRVLSPDELRKIDAYWRAANYLSVGQIYLLDNALLREPLELKHIKPRLLGHFGTTPGLNFIYAHFNRAIKQHDLNVVYIAGPGHGGPGLVANTYLEGTYSEFYSNIAQDAEGIQKLFKQFSFPGGIPSHASPDTPGSIHEGGELGYSPSRTPIGAAFDNPDLLLCAVVGDGEAETGPLATSWHSNKFLDPARDGAVLPILHLNGYKIAGPTVLARITKEELTDLMKGYGYTPHFVEGDDPELMHQLMAETLDKVILDIKKIQADARSGGFTFANRPRWPMIVLRSPKGWTGPKVVDGVEIEGTFRAHQVPLSNLAEKPKHIKILEEWMKSYRPEELFDANGTLIPELQELAPKGDAGGWGPTPTPTAGSCSRTSACPTSASTPSRSPGPGRVRGRGHEGPGGVPPRRPEDERRPGQLPGLQPRRDQLEPLEPGLRRHQPRLGRRDLLERRPCRRRRPGHGDALRAPVPGVARRLPADRPARVLLVLRGVHPHHRLDVQPARQVARVVPEDPLAAAGGQRSTTSFPRTSGGRTTTASATRTPASSTMSSTRRPTSSGSTSRPTPTPCSR